MSDPIRLLDVVDSPLDVGQVYAAVTDPAAGGVALFVGAVREHDGGKGVRGLGYSSHPGAVATLREVADEVVAAYTPVAVAVVHRVGDLVVGDLAVVVAVACVHRHDAFAAARQLIDELKGRVPIWKHQVFDDGSQEWVGAP